MFYASCGTFDGEVKFYVADQDCTIHSYHCTMDEAEAEADRRNQERK